MTTFDPRRMYEELQTWAAPTLSDQLAAMASEFNTVGQTWRAVTGWRSFAPDPEFDARAALTNEDLAQPTERVARRLTARSAEELQAFRDEDKRLDEMRRIQASGPLPPLAAALMVAVVDPINLLPMGWAARLAQVSRAASRAELLRSTALSGAVVGVASQAAFEPFAYLGDPYRTANDTLLDLMVSGVFGAGIGLGVGALASRGRVYDRARQVEVEATRVADVAAAAPTTAPPSAIVAGAVAEVQDGLAFASALSQGQPVGLAHRFSVETALFPEWNRVATEPVDEAFTFSLSGRGTPEKGGAVARPPFETSPPFPRPEVSVKQRIADLAASDNPSDRIMAEVLAAIEGQAALHPDRPLSISKVSRETGIRGEDLKAVLRRIEDEGWITGYEVARGAVQQRRPTMFLLGKDPLEALADVRVEGLAGVQAFAPGPSGKEKLARRIARLERRDPTPDRQALLDLLKAIRDDALDRERLAALRQTHGRMLDQAIARLEQDGLLKRAAVSTQGEVRDVEVQPAASAPATSNLPPEIGAWRATGDPLDAAKADFLVRFIASGRRNRGQDVPRSAFASLFERHGEALSDKALKALAKEKWLRIEVEGVAGDVRVASLGERGKAASTSAAQAVEPLQVAFDPSGKPIAIDLSRYRNTGRVERMMKALDDTVDTTNTLFPPKAPEDLSKVGEQLFGPEPPPQAAGAAVYINQEEAVLDALRYVGLKLVGHSTLAKVSKFLTKATFGLFEVPNLLLATSRLDSSRRLVAAISDTKMISRLETGALSEKDLKEAYEYAKARRGYSETYDKFLQDATVMVSLGVPLGEYAPLFSRINFHKTVYTLMAQRALKEGHAEAVAAGNRISETRFDEYVAMHAAYEAEPASASAGPHPVPPELRAYTKKVVDRWRSEIFRPMIDRAQKAGVFDNVEGGATPSETYWPLHILRELVAGQPTAFANILTKMFTEQRERALKVVQNYEDAVRATQQQRADNIRSIAEARKARASGQDHTGIYREFVQKRRELGTYNGRMRRLNSLVNDRMEYLANREFSDPEDYVNQVEKALRDAGLHDRHELTKFREEVYRQADRDEIAAKRVPSEEVRQQRLREALEAKLGDQWQLEDVSLALRWRAARNDLDAEIGRFEQWREANNVRWKDLTGGLDMPAFVERVPRAPENYQKMRALVRSSDPSKPARLQDEDTIRQEVQEIMQAITSGGNPYKFAMVGLRAHLKSRSLEFIYKDLAPFIEPSAARTVEHYVSTVVRDIEMMHQFKTLNPEEIVRPISNEAQLLASKAATPEEARKIIADAERDIAAARALLAIAHGDFNQPPRTPGEARMQEGVRTFLAYNYLTTMGSMALAQIGDFTSLVLRHGLARTLGAYVAELASGLSRSPELRKMAKEFGTISEVELLSYTQLMNDAAPVHGKMAISRAVDKITPVFSKATLGPWLNDMMRRTALRLTLNDWAKAVSDPASAGSKELREILARSGLRPSETEKLFRILKQHMGEDGQGRPIFNLDQWEASYPDLAEKFRLAVHTTVQRAIVTPQPGETPLWTQKLFGQVIMQFRRFTMASFSSLLIPALQSPGYRKMEIAVAALVFGTLSTVLRDLNTKGEIRERNAARWVNDALDMSGLTSAITEIDATLFRINPYISARYLLLGETPKMMDDRSKLAAIFGPTAGVLETRVPRLITLGLSPLPGIEYGPRHIAAFRESFPFQNHLLIRHPLDLAEKAMGGRERAGLLDWTSERRSGP